MKIAVTATRPSLDAEVDSRFGRSPWLVFVASEDMSVEAVENPGAALGGGAGIQTAQAIVQRGAGVVLTGHCGPNAHKVLKAGGVELVVGCEGTVGDLVEQYLAGELEPADGPDVPEHAGLGGSQS